MMFLNSGAFPLICGMFDLGREERPGSPYPSSGLEPVRHELKENESVTESGRCYVDITGECVVLDAIKKVEVTPCTDQGGDYYEPSALTFTAGPGGCTLKITWPRVEKRY